MTAMKKFWALCLLLAVGTSAFGQTGEPGPAENAPEQSFAVVNLSVCNMRRSSRLTRIRDGCTRKGST